MLFNWPVTVSPGSGDNSIIAILQGSFPYLAGGVSQRRQAITAWEGDAPAVGDPWVFAAPSYAAVPDAPATDWANGVGLVVP